MQLRRNHPARTLLALLLALQILLFPLSAELRASETPNVVIVYTDDQGYGDASCLNPDAKFQTPNIDRLAANGVTFTDGHSPDTVCTPSRYALLTGRYSWRTTLKRGVYGAERPCLIPDDQPTLASFLREHGYATCMVGKWHLGMDFPGTFGERDWTQPTKDMPLDKGFDTYWGIPASMNYGVLAWFDGRHPITPPTLFTAKKPNKIAIDDYRIMPPYPADRHDVHKGAVLETAPDFVDSVCLTRFTDEAIKWVRQQSADIPFFLYLPYTSPHKPVIPLPQFRGKSDAGAYGDFMIETDAHLGRLLDALDAKGFTENTLVLFSSDNGPEKTWPERKTRFGHASNHIYRDGKRSVYEGGHRVPFIVQWPAGAAKGKRSDRLVCQKDLFATLAEILDTDLPETTAPDAVSFLPALREPAADSTPRPALIHHGSSGRFAIREGNWKLVFKNPKGKTGKTPELYNLADDPSETTNVINAHNDIRARLTKRATEIVTNGNDTPIWDDVNWLDKTSEASDEAKTKP